MIARTQIRIAACLAVLLVLLTGSMLHAENVLLIIADDLGAESLNGFSTRDTAPTPTLDALAENGVRFTNCWANPICSPTRAALLTGRHGFRTGVGGLGVGINLEEGTIADAFANAGYRTACIGKWHLSNQENGDAQNPNFMGFDHFSGALGGGVGNYYSWTKTVNGETLPDDVENYATSENVDDAIAWINDPDAAEQPWFLWLAFNAPHAPFHAPPDDLHSYDLADENSNRNPLPFYEAMVEAMDREIGRLLDSLDDETLANTTIIFVGDNGSPAAVSSGVVGSKGSLYEGGVHVPCIVWGSSVAGDLHRTSNAPIHVVDVFNTALEIAGLDPEAVTPEGAATDSLSFAPYLSDPELAVYHGYHFAEKFTDPESDNDGKTIGDTEYKLVRFTDDEEEFFHLSDQESDLLLGSLSSEEQAAYDSLSGQLDMLLSSEWTQISEDSFEDDWGSYTSDGESGRSRRQASDGQWSVFVKADSSLASTDTFNLRAYDQLRIDFQFNMIGMDAGEGLLVEYFDGQQWHIVADFAADDHEESTFHAASVTLSRGDYRFRRDCRIRFTAAADENRDRVYLDKITVLAKPD